MPIRTVLFPIGKSRIIQRLSANPLLGCVVIIVVVALGYVAVRSLAAGSFASLEPENGTLANGAVAVTAGGTSGGKAVKFGSGSVPTPTPTPGSFPALKTVGNKIVSADTNQPVLLHGANLMRSDWSANYSMTWEEKAIPELAKWGGNIIVRGFASDPVNANDAKYLSMLDEYVSLAQASKMYVVFVWRSDAPDGAQPNVPDASAKAALPKLAARYKGNAHVMYGLQVEPHGTGSDWATLRPVFETMVDAIRTASAPYVPIVMVPGSNYSQDVSGAIANPVNRSNIVYKPHGYEPSSTYQTEFGNTYDAGLPVFVGEFAPAESATMTDMSAMITYTKQRGIGWAAWWMDYSNQGTEALVVSATDLSPTNPWGTTIKTEMLTTPALP